MRRFGISQDKWIYSEEIAQPPFIGVETFRTAQELHGPLAGPAA